MFLLIWNYWFLNPRTGKQGVRNELSRPSSRRRPPGKSPRTFMEDSPTESPSSTASEAPPKRKGRFHFWRCFWLTFLVVSLAYAWYSFYAPPNNIAWAEDFGAAQEQAAESGKPIILYFTATWCSPCRIMKRQVWADEEVMKLVNAEFVPVAIDLGNPDDAAVCARYTVKGTPVTIVTDPQGKALDWRAGRISKSEFLELIDLSGSPRN